MDVEIGLGKKARQAYGFDDIAIVPSRRTRDPDDVDIGWKLGGHLLELPLLASAMDGVVSPETAIALGRMGGLGVLNLEGIFTRYALPIAAAPAEIPVTLVAVAGPANQWQLDVPADALDGVCDAYLDIDYIGDVARIRAGDDLLADHFYYGPSWRPSLRHWGERALGKTLTLEIDPITPETKCYLEPAARPDFATLGERIAIVRSFRVEPQCETVLRAGL